MTVASLPKPRTRVTREIRTATCTRRPAPRFAVLIRRLPLHRAPVSGKNRRPRAVATAIGLLLPFIRRRSTRRFRHCLQAARSRFSRVRVPLKVTDAPKNVGETYRTNPDRLWPKRRSYRSGLGLLSARRFEHVPPEGLRLGQVTRTSIALMYRERKPLQPERRFVLTQPAPISSVLRPLAPTRRPSTQHTRGRRRADRIASITRLRSQTSVERSAGK